MKFFNTQIIKRQLTVSFTLLIAFIALTGIAGITQTSAIAIGNITANGSTVILGLITTALVLVSTISAILIVKSVSAMIHSLAEMTHNLAQGNIEIVAPSNGQSELDAVSRDMIAIAETMAKLQDEAAIAENKSQSYRDMLAGMAASIDRYSHSDFDTPTKQYPEDLHSVTQSLETLRGSLQAFSNELVAFAVDISSGQEDAAMPEKSHSKGFIRAIRELNAMAQQIRGKEHWYESILDSIPFPISVTDMKMNWTFVNRPVEQMLNVKRADVIGKHCSNWGAGICNTQNCGITCLRNNRKTTFFDQLGMDFRVDTNYLYDINNQTIGHIEVVQDISKMVSTQKAQANLVKGIVETSSSFVIATSQIADGSQTLALSASEQAESITKLSTSLHEVADNTKGNSEMASKAVALAGTIKEKAEKGSLQMTQMIQAVNDINEASSSINKVIKVIEDIAFQTNLLALNAAVEAARAGQFGKGFAVVAEEVRNLATKSAEAAKDTSSLISNSLEKAEVGAHIAGATATGFAEIVSGINESSQIVQHIATSSEKQTEAITHISLDIGNVEQILQQTKETAEQSAAASQELSGQTSILRQLIEQFQDVL